MVINSTPSNKLRESFALRVKLASESNIGKAFLSLIKVRIYEFTNFQFKKIRQQKEKTIVDMIQGDRINCKNASFDDTAYKMNTFRPQNYKCDKISRPNYQGHNKNDFASTRRLHRPREQVRYIRGNTTRYTQSNDKEFQVKRSNWQKTYNGVRNEIRGDNAKQGKTLTPFGVLTCWTNGNSYFRYITPHDKLSLGSNCKNTKEQGSSEHTRPRQISYRRLNRGLQDDNFVPQNRNDSNLQPDRCVLNVKEKQEHKNKVLQGIKTYFSQNITDQNVVQSTKHVLTNPTIANSENEPVTDLVTKDFPTRGDTGTFDRTQSIKAKSLHNISLHNIRTSQGDDSDLHTPPHPDSDVFTRVKIYNTLRIQLVNGIPTRLQLEHVRNKTLYRK